ncbi:MAG: FmdB family zinc ribbon protein [Thermoanaerobaculaceae bacterium]
MPLYEYKCEQCQHRFEVFQRLGQGADGIRCPKCGSENVKRMLSTFASAKSSSFASSGSSSSVSCSGFS